MDTDAICTVIGTVFAVLAFFDIKHFGDVSAKLNIPIQEISAIGANESKATPGHQIIVALLLDLIFILIGFIIFGAGALIQLIMNGATSMAAFLQESLDVESPLAFPAGMLIFTGVVAAIVEYALFVVSSLGYLLGFSKYRDVENDKENACTVSNDNKLPRWRKVLVGVWIAAAVALFILGYYLLSALSGLIRYWGIIPVIASYAVFPIYYAIARRKDKRAK